MRNVMKMAWEIARKAVDRMGGKVTEYLSESLKIAWAYAKEVKSDNQMKNRIKEMCATIYNSFDAEKANYKYGSLATFTKIFMEQKLKFNMMSPFDKIEYSRIMEKSGY